MPREISTTALTVEELLADIGVALENTDTVLPEAATPLTAGMTVEVTRVRTSEISETQAPWRSSTERPYEDAASEGLGELVMTACPPPSSSLRSSP